MLTFKIRFIHQKRTRLKNQREPIKQTQTKKTSNRTQKEPKKNPQGTPNRTHQANPDKKKPRTEPKENPQRTPNRYCIHASSRYGVDLISVVVGIDSLSLDITQLAKRSRVQGFYSFPSAIWASECIILCQSSIDECSLTEPLDPFIALGLFLTKGAVSIIDMPWNDDKTIKLLYSLAVEYFEGVTGNIPLLIDVLQQVLNERDRECDNMLQLLDNRASREALAQTIRSTKSRNQTLKQKYTDINRTTSTSSSTDTRSSCTTEPISSATEEPDPSASMNPISSTSTNTDGSPEVLSDATARHIQGMEFVYNFKKARIALGKKRMDWVTCLDQGKKMKLFRSTFQRKEKKVEEEREGATRFHMLECHQNVSCLPCHQWQDRKRKRVFHIKDSKTCQRSHLGWISHENVHRLNSDAF